MKTTVQKTNRSGTAAIIGIAAALSLYSGLSVLIANYLMKIPRMLLNKELTPDSLGTTYEDISFTSPEDKVKLKGWYLPGSEDSVIIIVNGGFQNRVDTEVGTLGLACDLVHTGYGVLMFDLRGRGESGDGKFGLANMVDDITGAVDYVKSRGFSWERINILAFSAGAAATCLYANLNNLAGIILDGCFARVPEAVKKQARLNGVPGPLTTIFAPGALTAVRVLHHDPLINPLDVVSGITCPILFIREQRDPLITFEEVEELFEASTHPDNQIWEVNEASHNQAYKIFPREYVARVSRFIARYQR